MLKKLITLILLSLVLTGISELLGIPFIGKLKNQFLLGWNFESIYAKLGLEDKPSKENEPPAEQ